MRRRPGHQPQQDRSEEIRRSHVRKFLLLSFIEIYGVANVDRKSFIGNSLQLTVSSCTLFIYNIWLLTGLRRHFRDQLLFASRRRLRNYRRYGS
jgi:hypothetical protein